MNPIISHQKLTKHFVKTHSEERMKKTPKIERKKVLTPADKEYYKQRFKFQIRLYKPCYIRLWYHTRNGKPEWYYMWQRAIHAQKREESKQFLNTKPIEAERVPVLYTPKNKQKLKSVYYFPKHPTNISEVDYNLCFIN
jgi:hypothetical protein